MVKCKYPCGRLVLTCSRRDSNDCKDARYAIKHWGGSCSFFIHDDSVEDENMGLTEDGFEYED